MSHRWQSTGLYEHPEQHQAGTYGHVILSTAGVYCLTVGRSIISCPQDWASKIHHEETVKSDYITIRITPAEKLQIEKSAKEVGLDSVSSYMLMLYRRQTKTE